MQAESHLTLGLPLVLSAKLGLVQAQLDREGGTEHGALPQLFNNKKKH